MSPWVNRAAASCIPPGQADPQFHCAPLLPDLLFCGLV